MPNVQDVVAGVPKGMQGHLDTLYVAEAAYARGVNVTCRGGFLRTRPGFVKEVALPAGEIQGCGRWSLNAGDFLVTVISGEVLVWPATTEASVVSFGQIREASGPCYFCQADRYLLVQDGVNPPVVLEYNETTGTVLLYDRTAPNMCLVPGTVTHYAHGRIHYVPTLLPYLTPAVVPADTPFTDGSSYNVPPDQDPPTSGKMTFISSDIWEAEEPRMIFLLSEHRLLNGGGAHGLPQEAGFITGMAAFRNAGTGTGAGPLVVFGREGISAFDVALDRASTTEGWAGSAFSTVLFTGNGTLSPAAVVPVNSDLFYLDTNGYLRTVRYSTTTLAGSSGTLSCTPLSSEVQPYLEKLVQPQLERASGATQSNRFFWTASGQYPGIPGAFRGLISMDLSPTVDFATPGAPAYDGLWTGYPFGATATLRYNNAQPAFFCVVSGAAGNAILRLDETAQSDAGGVPIECQVQTRALYCGNPIVPKRPEYAVLWLSEITTALEVEVLGRPFAYGQYIPLASFRVNVGADGTPRSRAGLRIPMEPLLRSYDPNTGDCLGEALAFQFLLRWRGHCRLDLFKFLATTQPDPAGKLVCGEETTVSAVPPAGETPDEYQYSALSGL